jgi:16S rRNA C1402 N4-methylase RsmH
MSYHSIEDKTVKETYKELVETGKYKLITKKAIMPDYKEIEKNKAARSAKLRIIERI